GSDTDRIGHDEYHAKIAMFPLKNGETIPDLNTGQLPGTVYSLGSPGANPASPVMYRVNAGGPAQASADDGPDWAAHTAAQPSSLHNSGSNTGTLVDTYSTPITTIDSTVPPTTPTSIFQTDRADPSSGQEMQWTFPVTPVQAPHVTVR